MIRYSLSVLFLLAAVWLPAGSARGESPFSAYARIDTATVRAGVYPIAAPLAGGPVRLLIIGPGEAAGYVARETAARLECTFEAVLTASRDRLGYPDFPAEDELFGEEAVLRRVLALLAEPWDAVWLDFRYGALPRSVQDALRAQTERGAGLVYRGEARDLRNLARKGKFNQERFRAVDLPGIPVEYAGHCGAGRIFAIPRANDDPDDRQAGDFCTRMVHTLMLAVGRDADIIINGMERPGKRVEHESIGIMNYRLDFVNSGPNAPLLVRARYRDSVGATVAESEENYLFKSGKGFIRVRYPVLPVGDYSVDISILDAEKVIALGWTSFRVESDDGLAELEVRNRMVRTGEFIVGRVRTSREVQEGMGLRVELVDSRGRRLDSTEIIPTPRQFGTGFALKANLAAGGNSFVRADLFKNNVLIHRMEAPVIIDGVRSGSFRLSGMEERESEFSRTAGYRKLTESGVSRITPDVTGLEPGKAAQTVLRALSAGLETVPSFTLGTGMELSGGPGSIIRNITASADTLRKLGVRSFMLRIEPGERGERSDPGYSPETLASFRAFLGSRYGTIERLNAAWMTDFAGFESVTPPDSGAARVDLLLHAREWNRRLVGDAARAIAHQDTGVQIILAGGDIGETTRKDIRTGMYGWEMPVQAGIRYSTAAEFGGNDLPDPEREDAFRAIPWAGLFTGMDGLWWRGLAGEPGSALVPGYGLHPAFGMLAGECREIGSGIDRLLRGTQRRFDPVAVLLMPDALSGAGRDAAESFRALCFDTGCIPRMLPLDFLRKDILDSLGIRVLILPGIRELDPVSAGRIEEFAHGGGRVIADIRPAVTGVMAPGTVSFDTLFSPPGKAERRSAEGSGGTVSGGILLGFDVTVYPTVRKDANGTSLRRFVSEILQSAGVEVSLPTDPARIAGGEYYAFESAGAIYLGYLPDFSSSGTEGLPGVLPLEWTGNRRYLYDVRAERYLGMLPDAFQKASSVRPALFSLLPYRVQGVELSFDKTAFHPGEAVGYRCAIQVQEPGTPVGRHVFAVRVSRPDGSEERGFGGVFEAADGVLPLNFSFLDSDPAGKWTVRVRDIATGKSAEKTLILMPRVGKF